MHDVAKPVVQKKMRFIRGPMAKAIGGVVLLVVAAVYFLGLLGLGFIALIRAERKDIPEVVRELAHWWHRWTWHRKS